MMISQEAHKKNLARAMELFEEQHDNPRFWDAHDCECHDKMVARINQEDGYPEGE